MQQESSGCAAIVLLVVLIALLSTCCGTTNHQTVVVESADYKPVGEAIKFLGLCALAGVIVWSVASIIRSGMK